ncbi:MAG TPA: amidase family protein [Acidimicrobiales bacterium]
MELTIIGAGAIGGTIGAHMARAGHDVVLCDADVDHVAVINRDGITIEGPVENFNVRVKAITPDQLPAQINHVAIAVKSHHTASAAALLEGRIAPGGYVVSFQNGFTAEVLAAAAGREKLIVSFVNFGADVMGPGRIMQGNIGTFRVGEPFQSVVTPRVVELVAALPYAVATDNIMGYLWGKEAYGAMLYAGAVSDLSIADSLEDPRYRTLMLAVAREVLAQSPVPPEGFDGFEPDDLEGSLARLVTFNRGSAKSHSGIYRDLMVRKRKTEVDDLLHDLKGPLTNYVGQLIHAIEAGERTCEVANLDLLATYERTERLGRPLNAVVRTLPAPRRRPEGPLHGVAIAVKDLIDVEGVPRGNGNPHDMVGPPALADAPIISILREAGADVFATTTLLEYAAGALNPDVAEAMNPYDSRRTAGGSSGGSAALVGVGACEVALGTDTGGSIRIPAHYCNVVGFKPTFGKLDVTGVQALSPSLDHVGLLTRDVATAETVFAAMTRSKVLAAPSGQLRVGVITTWLDDPVSSTEVRRVLANALARVSVGAKIVEVNGAALDEMRSTFDDIILYEAWRVHQAQVESDPSHYGPETLRLLLTASKVTRGSYDEAQSTRARLLPATDALYENIDVLLTPSTPYVAPETTPPIDTPDGATEGYFTSPFNLTGDPAVVVPCGFSDQGLPIGLQLSSPRDTDMSLLCAARVVEGLLAVERREPASR